MDADSTMAAVVARRSQAGQSKVGPLPFVLVGLVCTVVGCLVGSMFLGGSAEAAKSRGDGAVASFSYQGQTREIGQGDLHKLGIGFSVQESESFDATDILEAVKMDVLSQEARNQEISATDEDVSSYAQSWYGTADYASLGEGVLDAEAVRTALEQRFLVNRLQSERSSGDSPEPPPLSPNPPVGGPEAEGVPSAEYGPYLMDLFGEAFDVQNATWAQLDSPFYEAFKDESLSADEATYEQAMKAYHIAYSLYDAAASGSNDSWRSYVSEVMSGVEVVLYGVAM